MWRNVITDVHEIRKETQNSQILLFLVYQMYHCLQSFKISAN